MTHSQIDTWLELDVATALEMAAARHTALWREELAQFKLKPGRIIVRDGTLWIADQKWYELPSTPKLHSVLRIIGAEIAHAPYKKYMNGVTFP